MYEVYLVIIKNVEVNCVSELGGEAQKR